MALTTYVKGRAYDWSHAIGRATASGTGFNYPQTMCLGNDGDIFVAIGVTRTRSRCGSIA